MYIFITARDDAPVASSQTLLETLRRRRAQAGSPDVHGGIVEVVNTAPHVRTHGARAPAGPRRERAEPPR
jgi:hypothetical protein